MSGEGSITDQLTRLALGAEQLEDCGAEIVHYTPRVKLSELPHGPLPGEFEDLLDLIQM